VLCVACPWRSNIRHLMQKQFSRFLQSFVVFPILTANLILSPIAGVGTGAPTAAAIFPDQNGTLSGEVTDNKLLTPEDEVMAQKIDAYFAKINAPLAGYGHKLVTAAVENGLENTSVAVLAVVESTAGIQACKNPKFKFNVFGWMSCRGGAFKSYDEAIDTVATTIAAKNPSTAGYYANKTPEQVFEIYNGKANPKYLWNIANVRNQFSKQEIATTSTIVNT
jgi:hypothetical protein